MIPYSAPALLDRLYELADDSDHWPELVGALLEVFQGNETDGDNPLSRLEEERFLSWLTPHVMRVLAQHQKQLNNVIKDDFFSAFVSQQSVAVGLCDNQGAVLWMSRELANIFDQLAPGVTRGFIRSSPERPTVHSLHTRDGPRKLMLVDVPALGPNFCAVLLDTQGAVELDAKQLAKLYRLTPAEISVANMLCQGISPEDIALTNDTTLATVRMQIKKAMAKVGVTRQAELVATLHAHTARITFGAVQPQHRPLPVHAVLNCRGAKIAYNVIGPADGTPVFFFHSWAGSRLQALRGSDYLYKYGVKLIAFDRCGMGGSISAHGGADLACGELVQALADHLKIKTFCVLGYSLGSLYALQCAAAQPERINRVYLVCPVAPMRGLKDLRGVLPSGQLLMGLSMKAPALANALVRLWMSQMRRSPILYLNSVLPHLPPSDSDVMKSPLAQEEYVESFTESINQGDEALLRELGDMVSDWEYHLSVKQHTTIWHGLQDSHVPYVYAERLASEMASAQLHGVEGAGHFLIFHHWDSILSQIGKTGFPAPMAESFSKIEASV